MSAIDANNIGILRDLSADRGTIDSEGRDLHLICTRGFCCGKRAQGFRLAVQRGMRTVQRGEKVFLKYDL